MAHLNAKLSREIRLAVAGLPPYQGGPAVDYTHALVAYAVNITLLHIPGFSRSLAGKQIITPDTPALLVQRASGHGRIGAWSGVSGYVDVVRDPAGLVKDRKFDPVDYAIRAELREECQLIPAFNEMLFYLGGRYCTESHNGGALHILPILAVCTDETAPLIVLNTVELSNYCWVPLRDIPQVIGIGSGYMSQTLPRALNALR